MTLAYKNAKAATRAAAYWNGARPSAINSAVAMIWNGYEHRVAIVRPDGRDGSMAGYNRRGARRVL